MTALRMPEGCKVIIPIVYGSKSKLLSETEKTNRGIPSEHTHEWRVYLRGVGGVNLGGIIKKVSFKLHESFAHPIRHIENEPFEVRETGWGEFEIQIKIHFQDPQEKVINLSHFLKLYPSTETWNQQEQENATESCDQSSSSFEVVVGEKYDEIVFVEPHEYFYKPLLEYSSAAQFAFERETALKEAMNREGERIAYAIASLKETLNKAN